VKISIKKLVMKFYTTANGFIYTTFMLFTVLSVYLLLFSASNYDQERRQLLDSQLGGYMLSFDDDLSSEPSESPTSYPSSAGQE
jgi:hypothetical protein